MRKRDSSSNEGQETISARLGCLLIALLREGDALFFSRIRIFTFLHLCLLVCLLMCLSFCLFQR